MTRSQKMVMVALAVIVVLFVLITWRGAMQPECLGSAARTRPDCRPGNGIAGLGALTSPFSRGIDLPQRRYEVAPNASRTVRIAPASDKLRSLRLALVEGNGALLTLDNVQPDDSSDPDGMAKQRSTSENRLPYRDGAGASRRTMTLVVTEKGAVLTMRCTGPSGCVFETR